MRAGAVPEEAIGPSFDPALLLRARERAWACVHEIAGRVRVGMLEEAARETAAAVLRDAGSEKLWHRILVRFGPNTTKAFADASDPGVILQPNDIFFVDIGPVFDGHEGDCGKTFVVGNDPQHERCRVDCEALFAEVQGHWRNTGQSGRELYAVAEKAARARGWELNYGQGQGHRLSEFPHHAHHRGKLVHFGQNPTADRWILEIALRHPTEPFGGFFEDLLR